MRALLSVGGTAGAGTGQTLNSFLWIQPFDFDGVDSNSNLQIESYGGDGEAGSVEFSTAV